MKSRGATTGLDCRQFWVAVLAFAIFAEPSATQTVSQPNQLTRESSSGSAQTELSLLTLPPDLPQWQLWKITPDGTGLALFGKTPGYSCGSAQWSPDGSMVAFDTRRVDQELTASQVALIRADGTGFRLLGPGSMPSWSPDGTHLVIHTYDSPQTIVVMNADGSGRETILNHWGSPRWLRRGNRIAVIGIDRGLALFDLATGREHSILRPPHSMQPGFSFSPDGHHICFGEDSGGVWLAALDEQTMQTSIRNILPAGTFHHASWSPDGKRIVFASQSPEKQISGSWLGAEELHQLYMFDVDSGTPPKPLVGQSAEFSNTNPAWSPEGKTIVFSSLIPGEPPSGKSP